MNLWGTVQRYIADDSLFYGALLILIAVLSFGLGRLSVLSQVPQASIHQTASVVLSNASGTPVSNPAPAAMVTATAATSTASAITGPYVASKNGAKYYLTTCASANRIATQNRVYFKTVGEAVKAGYTPAANCPGL